MKNYQRMLNEAHKSRAAAVQHDLKYLGDEQQHKRASAAVSSKTYNMAPSLGSVLEGGRASEAVPKASFDTQLKPIFSQSTTSHPSQRISIISSSIGEELHPDSASTRGFSGGLQSRAQVHYNNV